MPVLETLTASDLRLAVAAENGLRVGLSGGYLRRGAEGTRIARPSRRR